MANLLWCYGIGIPIWNLYFYNICQIYANLSTIPCTLCPYNTVPVPVLRARARALNPCPCLLSCSCPCLFPCQTLCPCFEPVPVHVTRVHAHARFRSRSEPYARASSLPRARVWTREHCCRCVFCVLVSLCVFASFCVFSSPVAVLFLFFILVVAYCCE